MHLYVHHASQSRARSGIRGLSGFFLGKGGEGSMPEMIHPQIYVYMHVIIWRYADIYTHMCVYIFVHLYIFTHTHLGRTNNHPI